MEGNNLNSTGQLNSTLINQLLEKDEFDSVIELLLPIINRLHTTDDNFKAINYLISAYFYKSQYAKVIEYSFHMLTQAIELDEHRYVARSYFILASTYKQVMNYPKALYYGKQALDAYQRIGDREHIAYSHNTLSAIYVDTNNLVLAKYHLSKAFEGAKLMPHATRITLAFNLAAFKLDVNEINEAIQILEENLNEAASLSSKRVLAQGYYELARAYEMTGNYLEAKNLLYQIIHIHEIIQDKFELSRCYKKLALLDEKLGDYQAAYLSLKQHSQLRRELNVTENYIHSDQLEKKIPIQETYKIVSMMY